MGRSAEPFDDAGHGRRWGASVALSVLLHAAGVGLLAGVVYQVAGAPERPRALSDVVMSLRSGGAERFVASPANIVTPMNEALARAGLLASGEDASAARGPSLSEVLDTLRTRTVGTSALGEVGANSSGTALDAVSAALGATSTGGASIGGAGANNAGAGGGTLSVAFAGLEATGEQAKSIVYVVDASGPMVSTLPEVFGELMRSVDALQPTQQFGVVLFRDNGVSTHALFAGQLRDATPSNRTALRGWLTSVNAAGRSNPMDGLRTGLSLRPQALFLLSRSIPRGPGNPWDVGSDTTMTELEALNPAGLGGRRLTVVKTVQFLEPDPTGVMERIGRLHGGSERSALPYRVLRREELRRP